MHAFKALIFSCLVALAIPTFADPQTPQWPQPEAAEKEAMAEWVQSNSVPSVNQAKSASIVETAYYYAKEEMIDVTLILAVMHIESKFFERASSPDGARGLMQVIPRWHKDKFKGRNPLNPQVSTQVGAQVLRECWEKSKGNLQKTVTCYVGGPNQKYYQTVLTSRKQLTQAARERSLDKLVHFVGQPKESLSYARSFRPL